MVMSVKGHNDTAQMTCERQTSQTLPMARDPCDSYVSYGEGALTSGLGAPALQPTHTLEQHRASRQSGPRRPPSEKAGVSWGHGARRVPQTDVSKGRAPPSAGTFVGSGTFVLGKRKP